MKDKNNHYKLHLYIPPARFWERDTAILGRDPLLSVRLGNLFRGGSAVIVSARFNN